MTHEGQRRGPRPGHQRRQADLRASRAAAECDAERWRRQRQADEHESARMAVSRWPNSTSARRDVAPCRQAFAKQGADLG